MNTGFLLFVLIIIALAIIVFFYLQRRERRKLTVQAPYTEALHALLSGDKNRAMQRLRETVQGDTNNIDAYLRLGDLHFDLGDSARGLKIHRMLTLRVDLTKAQRMIMQGWETRAAPWRVWIKSSTFQSGMCRHSKRNKPCSKNTKIGLPHLKPHENFHHSMEFRLGIWLF